MAVSLQLYQTLILSSCAKGLLVTFVYRTYRKLAKFVTQTRINLVFLVLSVKSNVFRFTEGILICLRFALTLSLFYLCFWLDTGNSARVMKCNKIITKEVVLASWYNYIPVDHKNTELRPNTIVIRGGCKESVSILSIQPGIAGYSAYSNVKSYSTII